MQRRNSGLISTTISGEDNKARALQLEINWGNGLELKNDDTNCAKVVSHEHATD